MIFLSPQARATIESQFSAAVNEVLGEGDSLYRNLLGQYEDPIALLNANPDAATNRTKDRIYPRKDPDTGEYVIGINHKIGRSRAALSQHEDGMSFADALRQFRQDVDLAARQSDRYIRANRLTDMPAQIGEALTGLTFELGADSIRELDLASDLRRGDLNAAAEKVRQYSTVSESDTASVRQETDAGGQPRGVQRRAGRGELRANRTATLAGSLNEIGRILANPQAALPSYATAVGLPRVANQTRDQIPDFSSTPQGRVISGDFNSVTPEIRESGYTFGHEIVMPRDSTPEEIQTAEQYLSRLDQFYADQGLERANRGVKVVGRDTNRGVDGVIHVEPFFADDLEARRAIEANPEAYAALSVETLGSLPNSRFIPPHKQNDPGAVTPDGVSERDWWSDTLFTHFADNIQEPVAPFPTLPPVTEAEEVGVPAADLPPVPQVSFEETQVASIEPAAPPPIFTEDSPQVTFNEEILPSINALTQAPILDNVDPLLRDDGSLGIVLASDRSDVPTTEPSLASRAGTGLRNVLDFENARADEFREDVSGAVGGVRDFFTDRIDTARILFDARAALTPQGRIAAQWGDPDAQISPLVDAARNQFRETVSTAGDAVADLPRMVSNIFRDNPTNPVNEFVGGFTGTNPGLRPDLPAPAPTPVTRVGGTTTGVPGYAGAPVPVGPQLPEFAGPPVPNSIAIAPLSPLTSPEDGFAREPLSYDQEVAALVSRAQIENRQSGNALLDFEREQRGLIQPQVDTIFGQLQAEREQEQALAAANREAGFVEATRRAAQNRTIRNLRTAESLAPNASGTNVALEALGSLDGLTLENSNDALRGLIGASESGGSSNLFDAATDQQARAFQSGNEQRNLQRVQDLNTQLLQPPSDFRQAIQTTNDRSQARNIFNSIAQQEASPTAPIDIFASEENLTAAQILAAQRRELEERQQLAQQQLTRILSHPEFKAATERLRTGRR